MISENFFLLHVKYASLYVFFGFGFCSNVKYDSVMVLIISQGGNMEIVKLFLEMGAGPIDSFEDSNYSPLCKASEVWITYRCIGLLFC